MYVHPMTALAVPCRKGVEPPPPPSEELPLFLSAQAAPGDPGVTARMALGPATQTFVLELRCLEDGGPGPGTLSGEGWGVETIGHPQQGFFS